MVAALVAALVAGSLSGAQVLVTTSNDCRIRTGPDEKYNRICVLPAGVPLWAMGRKGDWYHVRLCPSFDAWVYKTTVKGTGRTRPLEPARLAAVSVRGCEVGSRVAMELSRPVPFRIVPRIRPARLEIDLFGCRAGNYWVRQFPDDKLSRLVQPVQMGAEWVRVTVELQAPAIVGYFVEYRDGHVLTVDIRRPFDGPALAGKRIVLDPGHGGRDRGAIGPNGVEEKEVNLEIALRAARMLEQGGANVVLTRADDAAVGPAGCSLADELEARLLVGLQARADLFVSIHNNATGDKPNGDVAGTEAYYWTEFSQPLARHLANAVSAALGTQCRFVAWRPFHVLRATDCPRALVECAYVSNPAEAEYMARPEFRARAAEGIVSGIRAYLAEACWVQQ